MKTAGKLMVLTAFVLSAAWVFSACGGGDDDSPTTGTITGKVSNNATGAAISGASVTDGTATVTTDASGNFTISDVAPAARKVLTISASGFAFTSKITAVAADTTSRVDVALVPSYSTTVDTTTAQVVAVPSSTARVALPANGLKTAAGAAPVQPVTVNLTPVDPSSNPQVMPGDFTTSAGGMIESYGAMELNFSDSAGAPLNLASGQSATIRIPVAAVNQGSAPLTMPAFFYDATAGQWVQEGTLNRGGTAPNLYYEGTVTHFSYWNADQVYSTTCITGKVVDSDGHAVKNARVETEGRDYIGTSQTYSASDGTFTVLAKANSEVIVTASTTDRMSNSVVVETGAAGSTCTELDADLKLGAAFGSPGSGSAKIKLTWGLDPDDLDSHLTIPLTDPDTSERWHVYYSNDGSLTAEPYAELDVDDTSSFGPEVITISRFEPGTYRYSVHHYSGSGTIYNSPARVELLLNGATTIFTPPAAGSGALADDSVWVVFEMVVAANGNATVNPINTYQHDVSAGDVNAPPFGGVSKPPLSGGSW